MISIDRHSSPQMPTSTSNVGINSYSLADRSVSNNCSLLLILFECVRVYKRTSRVVSGVDPDW
jgi:hypothetical protein